MRDDVIFRCLCDLIYLFYIVFVFTIMLYEVDILFSFYYILRVEYFILR